MGVSRGSSRRGGILYLEAATNGQQLWVAGPIVDIEDTSSCFSIIMLHHCMNLFVPVLIAPISGNALPCHPIDVHLQQNLQTTCRTVGAGHGSSLSSSSSSSLLPSCAGLASNWHWWLCQRLFGGIEDSPVALIIWSFTGKWCQQFGYHGDLSRY